MTKKQQIINEFSKCRYPLFERIAKKTKVTRGFVMTTYNEWKMQQLEEEEPRFIEPDFEWEDQVKHVDIIYHDNGIEYIYQSKMN